jgi:hypothetical protein
MYDEAPIRRPGRRQQLATALGIAAVAPLAGALAIVTTWILVAGLYWNVVASVGSLWTVPLDLAAVALPPAAFLLGYRRLTGRYNAAQRLLRGLAYMAAAELPVVVVALPFVIL